jgi:hypothetical protein
LRECGATVYDFKFDDLIALYGHVSMERDGEHVPAFGLEQAAVLACEHLQAAVYRFCPDVIVLVSCFWITPETMRIFRQRPHTIVGWFTESPYEDDKQQRVASLCDLSVVNDPTNLADFLSVGPAYYAPHSYDPMLHCPGAPVPEWACDVAFAGTGFPSRIDLIRSVDWSGIDFRLAGMWAGAPDLAGFLVHPPDECFENADTVRLYRSARMSFNLYRRESNAPALADGWAMGPREVELAATGTFFLRDPRGEGDEILHMLPTFDASDPAGFGEMVRWWLAHDEEREKAARLALEAVADRTFKATASRLLFVVDRLERVR